MSGAVKVIKFPCRRKEKSPKFSRMLADWPFETFDESRFQVKYVGGDTLGRTSLGEVSLPGPVPSGPKSLELPSYRLLDSCRCLVERKVRE